ncbi:ABC transporter substrate-binding protein [Ornithinibacillus sp. 4-3]|uniref:ABC transporter substrate-binding protein n=1 Tax=Ornithinibacillus sp. 4-3 TaxID=3231488 RepID=A0AB39HPM2_9BACI
MKKKLLFLLLIFASALLVLAACSEDKKEEPKEKQEVEKDNEKEEKTEEAEQEPQTGGTLNFAFNAQPPGLDPVVTTATATRDIARNIYEQLVTFDSEFQVQPMLAESFEANQEEKTVTFKLRQGVKFHNGDEMKAEDVVASMEKWANESAQAKSFLSGVTFQAEDDYTVVAHLDKTGLIDMFVFADLTQIAAIMPKEIVEAAEEGGVTEYIGTGPYKLEEWKQDQYIHLTKFADYQAVDKPADGLSGKKEAYVDDIYFHIVTDASTRVAGVQSGEYHMANFIPQDSAAQLDADPNVENKADINSIPGIIFNKKVGVFQDQKMRQAIAAALDLEEIMLAAYGSEEFFTMNHELMLEEQTAWYTDAGKDQYNQKDLEKAKKLLEEAGYNGETIRLMTSREYEDYYMFAIVMQEQLKQIGVNLELEVYEWATVIDKQSDPSAYDMTITGWGIRPTPIQYPFLDSRAEWAGWSNSAEIDGYIDAIQASENQEEAKAIMIDLQEEFWNYLPIIKVGNKMDIAAVRTEVSGYDTTVGPILWNISISE